VAGLKLLFLVMVPAARSSLGLRDVPDVGDRCAAELRRWRHAPSHQHHFALGISVADDGGWIIGKHSGHWRQVADVARFMTRNSARMASWFVVIE
jgi:hypothetical protein